jgi:hypothetical protein
MPPKLDATTRTGGDPWTRRHRDGGVAASHRLGADLTGLRLPDLIVTVAFADESVCDFVKKGLADFFRQP